MGLGSKVPVSSATYLGQLRARTANLRTNIMDLGGFDSSITLILKGWNSRSHRGFPGSFESSNLSRDNVSRKIELCRHAPKGHPQIAKGGSNHEIMQRIHVQSLCDHF